MGQNASSEIRRQISEFLTMILIHQIDQAREMAPNTNSEISTLFLRILSQPIGQPRKMAPNTRCGISRVFLMILVHSMGHGREIVRVVKRKNQNWTEMQQRWISVRGQIGPSLSSMSLGLPTLTRC
jgi:hypothetical protein